MANRLKVAKVFSIRQLYDQGWSQRRIARELEISREAVARHLKEMAESPPAAGLADDPNQAKAPTGSEKSEKDSKPTKAPTGSRSLCETWRQIVLDKLQQGLSAQRIFQDLVEQHGFEGKYPSVRRFVAKLNQTQPLPFRRMEVAAGEEAQIDFGTGVAILDEDGRRRRTHVLRVVLTCCTIAGAPAVTVEVAKDNPIPSNSSSAPFFSIGNRRRGVGGVRLDWWNPNHRPASAG